MHKSRKILKISDEHRSTPNSNFMFILYFTEESFPPVLPFLLP
jgi:hypothetical protein